MILVNKPLGKTPLEILEKLKKDRTELLSTPLSYAGRLDPMAEGLLLILVGDECKNREQFLGLDKTYEFEVLCGFETDTFDLLGMADSGQVRMTKERLPLRQWADRNDKNKILRDAQDDMWIKQFIGKQTLHYPPYSSKTVNGKPLWEYARENRLSEIEIPTKEVEIKDFRFLSQRSIAKDKLEKEILRRIKLVNGDFRQEEIKARWQEVLQGSQLESYPLLRFSVTATSGLYVRSLAMEMEKKLNTPAIAFSIKRTKVGSYSL